MFTTGAWLRGYEQCKADAAEERQAQADRIAELVANRERLARDYNELRDAYDHKADRIAKLEAALAAAREYVAPHVGFLKGTSNTLAIIDEALGRGE